MPKPPAASRSLTHIASLGAHDRVVYLHAECQRTRSND
jgi:hypothetical protein